MLLDDNCELIHNLKFCDSVAYAVPRNRSELVDSSLASYYDDYASSMFTPFAWSLEQIPCTTTPEGQYSLATGCGNCSAAYKQWLCAVTIPRCADYSSSEPYLQARNVNQSFFNNGTTPTDEFGDLTFSQANKSVMYLKSSRVSRIDDDLKPGPYKEVLPCIGLCYSLMQNCPAALGFACPLAGKGQNHSYGYATNGSVTCNLPGAIRGVNGASGLSPGLPVVWAAFFAVLGLSISGI